MLSVFVTVKKKNQLRIVLPNESFINVTVSHEAAP